MDNSNTAERRVRIRRSSEQQNDLVKNILTFIKSTENATIYQAEAALGVSPLAALYSLTKDRFVTKYKMEADRQSHFKITSSGECRLAELCGDVQPTKVALSKRGEYKVDRRATMTPVRSGAEDYRRVPSLIQGNRVFLQEAVES